VESIEATLEVLHLRGDGAAEVSSSFAATRHRHRRRGREPTLRLGRIVEEGEEEAKTGRGGRQAVGGSVCKSDMRAVKCKTTTKSEFHLLGREIF
jgi:hypothetical protein